MKFYITGTRRGLGKALAEKYGNCENLEDCDVFVNCKHDCFSQVELLYDAAALGKKIINISKYLNNIFNLLTSPLHQSLIVNLSIFHNL